MHVMSRSRRLGIGLLLAAVLCLTSCGDFFVKENGNGGGGGGGQTGTPRFAYVPNSGFGIGGAVAGFTINAANGALTPTPGSPVAAGTSPISAGADAGGRFLYVADQAGSVSAFVINRADGSLGVVTGSPFIAGNSPVAIAVDPSARFVYVANSGSNTLSGFVINTTTGGLIPFANAIGLAGTPTNAHMDPTGRFLYVTEGSGGTDVFQVKTDGSLTAVRTVPVAPCAGASDIAIDALARFAYIPDGSAAICAYAINPSNGDLIPIGSSSIPAGTRPLAGFVSPTGKLLAAVNQNSNSISTYVINSDGTLAAVASSPFATGNAPVALSIDPSGHFIYVANSNEGTLTQFTINSDGSLFTNGTIQIGFNPTAVVTTP